jgi:hypothetical protein
VLATNGDTHLGGEDFDQRIMEHFMKIVKSKHNVDLAGNHRALAKLRRESEKAKRALSSVHEVKVEVEGLIDGQDFSERLTRAKFEELNMDLFKKCLAPLTAVIKDAGLKKTDIDEIILVGGSTRIPKVQQILKVCHTPALCSALRVRSSRNSSDITCLWRFTGLLQRQRAEPWCEPGRGCGVRCGGAGLYPVRQRRCRNQRRAPARCHPSLYGYVPTLSRLSLLLERRFASVMTEFTCGLQVLRLWAE